MIVCLDVDYRKDVVVTARLMIPNWDAKAPASLVTIRTRGAAPDYIPGAFYRREMPYLVAALEGVTAAVVVIDGYVWLGPGTPGLGAHLWDAIGKRAAVVGVAKTPFRGAAPIVREVCRGESKTPLFVTAAGMEPDVAASHIGEMHGPHRMPAMLRRVDRACRDAK